jgi:predicted transcriptional regulator
MSKIELPWEKLEKRDWEILKDLYQDGADCAKFISRRFKWDLKETMERLKKLESMGFLKRVEGRFATIRGKFKHMNHTYYEVTREVKLYFRKNLNR